MAKRQVRLPGSRELERPMHGRSEQTPLVNTDAIRVFRTRMCPVSVIIAAILATDVGSLSLN